MPFSPRELSILEKTSVLGVLPPEAIEACVGSAERVECSAGTYIHHKGDDFTGVFILLDGEVKALGVTSQGLEYSLIQLGPGQSFGEIAYLDGGERTHDTRCLTDCVLARLSRAALDSLCQQYPTLYQSLVRLTCRHVRQSFQMLDDFLTLNPEQLLAKRLLALAESQPNSGGHAVTIKQDDLASLVGISRQSVNRILRKWQDAQWIGISYSAIELIERSPLESLFRAP